MKSREGLLVDEVVAYGSLVNNVQRGASPICRPEVATSHDAAKRKWAGRLCAQPRPPREDPVGRTICFLYARDDSGNPYPNETLDVTVLRAL